MNATAVLHPFSSALVPAALRKVWVTSSLHMVLAVPQTVEPLKYLYIFFYESAQGRELLFRITCWPSGKHCALTWNWRAQHMRRVETRQSSTMYFLCKYSRIPFRAFDSSSMFACIKLWMHSRWGWNRLDYFGFHMGTFPGPVFGVPAQQALEQRNFFFFYASWSLIFSCGRGLRPLDATFLALGQWLWTYCCSVYLDSVVDFFS